MIELGGGKDCFDQNKIDWSALTYFVSKKGSSKKFLMF